MVRRKLVVAALLLANLAGIAAAADTYEHSSKHAQKLMATLDSLGIDNPQVRKFVSEVDAHIDNGYLNLAGRDAPGGSIMLRYRFAAALPSGLSNRRLELAYQPQDVPHLEVVARTDGVTISYHFKF
ncbi:MAG: hypothetical protein KGI29_07580 [Pseudomonadota bacterium]|nr:hypothetical protein [Pseudomonadota bacterium]MDE3037478.1 hypothetical protein [Pseudomonadota bacterium]